MALHSFSTSKEIAIFYDLTLTAAAATFDTGAAGFSADWNHLRVVLYCRTDEAVVQSGALLTFNNDTGANYDRQVIRVTNTTVSGARAAAANNIVFSALGASAGASAFTQTVIDIACYSQTTAHKTYTANCTQFHGTAASDTSEITDGRWRSTAAISRLIFTGQTASNFIAGSRLTVYAT